MSYFDENSYLLVFTGLLVLVMAVVQVYFLNSASRFNGTELLKHYLINVARVDPSMRETVMNAYNNCNQGNVHDLESKLAKESGVTVIFKNIGAIAIMGVLVLAVVLLWAYQAWTRYKAGTGILGFKRGAVMREIWPLMLLAVPLLVEAVIHVFCYARFRYFTNISLVRLVKTVRLQQEMKYLKENQPAAGDIDPTKPCFSNCLSPADRQALLKDLDDKIAQYDEKVAAVTASTNPKFFSKLKEMQGITGIVLASLLTVGSVVLLSFLTLYHKTLLPVCIVVVILFITLLMMFAGQSTDIKTASSPEYNTADANILFCDDANPVDPFSKMSNKSNYRRENDATIASWRSDSKT